MTSKQDFTEKFMEIAGKIGSEKHLIAIRDSFIAAMPITMAGSIAVLLNVFFRDIPTNMGYDGFVEAMQPLIDINGYVYFGTIAVIALFFAFNFGYNLSKVYKVDPLSGGVISFASFIATMPQALDVIVDLTGVDSSILEGLRTNGLDVVQTGGEATLTASEWGVIQLSYAGATGLFTALVIGFLSTLIYVYFTKKNFMIKLPDNVPPAVNKAFAAIIPGTVAIYASGILAYLVFTVSGQPINDMISQYIQMPLMGLSQGIGSVILLTFLVQVLWFFGLHGHNVLAPVMDGIYGVALNENTAVYEATRDIAQLPWQWTRGSFDAYVQMGGSGVTLGLIIAIYLFSKREEHKTIANLSAPMGIFNINEPVIFGMPIVLNPTFIIPWLVIAPLCAAIGYIATSTGLVPPVFLAVPWITPPGLYAYLATGGSFMAGAVALFNLFISFLIWTPFVIAANKIDVKE